MHRHSSYNLLTLTNFYNKPVQVTKETADSSSTKNRLGYKNNWLVVAYQPHQQLMEVYGDG